MITAQGGWPSPLKNDGGLVKWDDFYYFPTEWKNKIHVPNHQPVMISYDIYSDNTLYVFAIRIWKNPWKIINYGDSPWE